MKKAFYQLPFPRFVPKGQLQRAVDNSGELYYGNIQPQFAQRQFAQRSPRGRKVFFN